MANKSVFVPLRGRSAPVADTVNLAGGPAYDHDPRHRLAQLAITGTFSDTFYADGLAHLEDLLQATAAVTPLFIAQTAVFARRYGYMKDTPAFLLAVLSGLDTVLFAGTFGEIVDNGRMLRTFVQIMRSGATGRKSLGSCPKRMIQNWLLGASDRTLINASVGQSPSLADIIKMVHPKADDPRRNALFAWLIGKPCDVNLLPQAVQDYIRFKEAGDGPIPDVPFQMLTQLPLRRDHWATIAERGGWQMVRMNLRTFARHDVFSVRGMDKAIARKLADRKAISQARVMPYQLMMAHGMAGGDVPKRVQDALEDAMEIALENVPAIDGRVVVCTDVSGSMRAPVTGYRRGQTSAVRYVDVAALVSAALLRKNRSTLVLPFDTHVHEARLSARDSVMTNARKLAAFGGGGTNCSKALERLNKARAKPDLVVFVSDNQSWADGRRGLGTGMMAEWEALKQRVPHAKLACIDIAPYGTAQAQSRLDILNVGGFTDAVFDTLAAFAKGEAHADYWVREIERIQV